jgi:hypothetical protein
MSLDRRGNSGGGAALSLPRRQEESEAFTMKDIPWAAVAPVFALLAVFLVYCLVDLSRSEVQHLPKWAWAIICVISVPLGGIIYLTVGRKPRVE